MSIGAGIALAGVWLFAAACALSRTVTASGMILGIVVALVATLLIAT